MVHSHGDGGSRTGKRLEVHSTYGLETHALSHGAVSLFGAGWPYGCHQYFAPSASIGDMLHNDMLIHKLSIFVSSVAFFANPRALSQRLFGAAVRSPISSCRTRERKRSIRQSKAFIGQLVPSPIFPQIVNTPSETWFGIGTTYWNYLCWRPICSSSGDGSSLSPARPWLPQPSSWTARCAEIMGFCPTSRLGGGGEHSSGWLVREPSKQKQIGSEADFPLRCLGHVWFVDVTEIQSHPQLYRNQPVLFPTSNLILMFSAGFFTALSRWVRL